MAEPGWQDPAAREARAAELFAEAGRAASVRLPALTREELAALGSLEACVVRDEVDLSWWSTLDVDARRAVTVAALRGLLARELLDPLARREAADGGAVEISAAPDLALALLGRSEPASIVVVGSEPAAGRLGAFRLYGLTGAADGRPWFIVEHLEDSSVHRFLLCTAGAAAGELAAWAAAPPPEPDVGPAARLIEIARARGDEVATTTLDVTAGAGSLVVTDRAAAEQGGAGTTQDELQEQLALLLERVAQP